MKTSSRFSNWITARWHNHLEQQLKEAGDDARAALKERLSKSVVVHPEDILEGRVQFGSLVTVFSVEEEEEQTFQIVSRDESFSARGMLDQSSPLAQALFGAREGEVVKVLLANGSNCDYEITHIRVPT